MTPQPLAPGSALDALPGATHAFDTGGAPVVVSVPAPSKLSAFWSHLRTALIAALSTLVLALVADLRSLVAPAPAPPITPQTGPSGQPRPSPVAPPAGAAAGPDADDAFLDAAMRRLREIGAAK